MDPIKVGGEIEAWCTSCKDLKWHVVVAMVGAKPAKVECHGCHKQHVYRAAAPGTKTEKAPRAPSTRTRSTAVKTGAPLEDATAELKAGAATARPFSVRDRFAVGEFVRHPTFGVGKVTALPAPQKMEVAFLD